MKILRSLLPALFLAACSLQATQPLPTSGAPDTVATLFATAPSLDVRFDGSQCDVPASTELIKGKHVFALHNQSPEKSYLITGRLYSDRHLEDFLQWFDEHCGPTGSICDQTGEAPWISWLFEAMATDQGPGERYYQYDLDVDGEYLVLVTRLDGSVWPCGTYQVVASG